jgi:hypothetical protein
VKRLLLAVTALGLAGTIGTANAAPVSVPLQASSLTIWSGDTTSPADPTGVGFRQQALPSASAAPTIGTAGGLPLVSTVGVTGASGPIDFNLPMGGTNTIQGFFNTASAPFTSAGCPALSTCAGGELSDGTGNGHAPYLFATLFEFDFTAPSTGPLTVTHDDGVSLFVAGTEPPGSTCTVASCPGDLFKPADAAPTGAMMTEAATLTGGVTYDLWYTSANGLPEVLHTDFVPAPLIGNGLLVLLAVGGVLFGGKLLESLKTRRSHA